MDGREADWPSLPPPRLLQRGALLATEIKNNAAKLARFTIASLLAGAHALKLGFVSRAAKADSGAHQVRRFWKEVRRTRGV